MTTPARALLLALVAWLGACEGSEVRRLLNADLGPAEIDDDAADALDGDEDGLDDVDADSGEVSDGAEADATEDVETDVAPDSPAITFWFVGATGELGRDLAEIVLTADDEPAAYDSTPGFQIDVVAETRGVAMGEVARLYIDDRLAASAQVAVEDGVGRLGIPGLTLPQRGAPLRLRLATRSAEDDALEDEKVVTLDLGPCEIAARLALTAEGCLEDGGAGIIAPPRTVRVEVERVAGACDRVTGTASIAGGAPIALDEVPFTGDGTAELVVPIGFGQAPSGALTVEVTALHPTDPSQDATVVVSAPIDLAPPGVRWVTPPAEMAALTLADDQDGAPANGIQYEVQATLIAAPDERVRATLFVDESAVAEVSVRGGGTVAFGTVSFVRDGPTTLRVEVADGCDNRATESLSLDIAATPDTIVIVTPDDGAVLLASSDGDSRTAEIYDTTFEVAATGVAAGTRLDLLCQPAVTSTPSVWIAVGTSTVATPRPDDRYRVPVQADVRRVGQVSRCIARMSVEGAADSPAVRVTFAVPGPTLVITAPAAGSCLGTDTLGLSGVATGLAGRTLELSGASPDPRDGPIVISDFAVVSSSGDWSGTYPPGADGRWSFTLSGTDVWGNSVSSEVAVDVDRAAPIVRFDAPGEILDASAFPDGAPTTPGYQTSVAIAVLEAAPEDAVCLAVNGRPPACLQAGNAGRIVFDDVTLAPGANALVVTASDSCGNTAAPITRTVTLVVDNPIRIVAPATGTTLLASGDGNPTTTTTYETAMTVDADAAIAGATVIIECRAAAGGAYTTVATRAITSVSANGRYDVPVVLDTLVLGTSAQCRARVDLPSPGASAVVDLTIGLPAPTLAITTPVAGTCVRADIPVTGSARSLEGRTVTARLTAGQTALAATGTAGAATWGATIALGTAPDGAYSLIASASDTFGNAATSAAVALVVDRTAPALGLTAPGPDVTEADDSSTAAGVQVDVVATFQDARPGGQTCLALGQGAPVCQAAGATATFTAVTLQPGDNTLTLTGTDACGNLAIPVVRTTRLQLDAPSVAITTPSADLVTVETTIDIVATVTDPDLVPLTGLLPKLLANGNDTMRAVRDTGAGTYIFADVPLMLGASTTFTVEVSQPNTATGRSGPRVVTHKDTMPAVTLTSPGDGAVFLVASTACAIGRTDCVLTARAATTNAEDGSAAALAVTCGGAPTTYQATVSGGAAAFANVVLKDGQSCTLTPSVIDLASQQSTGTTVTVSVDRTAPTLAIATPGPILQGEDDADPVTTGMQHALAAEVGGVAFGAVVSAVLSWNDGAPHTRPLSHIVTATTPDGQRYLATFEDAVGTGLVSWPDGVVTVVVSVSDSLGNPASATLVISVDTDAAVRITGPATVPADSCGGGCAAGTTCTDGACWIAWGIDTSRQLVAVAAGMETTSNNIRVCSDHPALSGTGAAVCASPASATGPYRRVSLANTSGGVTLMGLATLLPEGAQRLVAEILPVPGGDWLSSLAATNPNERQRRVFVDLQAPGVTALSSPSDTLAPLGTLNAAEQAALPRAYDIAFTTTEAGRADVFVNGVVAVTRDVPAGESIVRVTLPEGSPDVWVVITDAIGNRSPLTPGQGARTYRPIVDVTAPTLVFTRPAKSPLRAGDVLDVVLSSNAAGRTVTVFDGASEVASGPVAGGGVTFSDATWDILSDGSHTLTATVSDVAGNPTTAATNPTTVLVDTLPPSGTIIAPTAGQAFVASDDADPAAGFQVSVLFATTGATSWSLSTANGCTSSLTGCQAPTLKASGGVTNPGGNEPARLVTLDPTAAVSYHRLSLRTRDAAGNEHLAEVGVSLTLSCAVSFTNLPASGWYNAATCGSPTACPNVLVSVASAGDCGNRVALFDGATELGVITDPTAESFSITITDGVPLALEAVAYQGSPNSERGATGVVAIGVDLRPPAVSFVARTVQGFDTPAEGASLTWSYLDDLDPNLAGIQLHAAVEVADAHAEGGALTLLTATSTAGTAALIPANGTLPIALSGASPITAELVALTLADHLTHTVTVTARDAAGNTDTGTFTATVDVTRPEVVTITDFVVNPRRPSFDIAWTAIGIEGAPADAYEIRYSDLPIVTEDDWDAACDASLVFGSDPMPAPALPGESMAFTVGGPDTRAFTDACKLDVRFEDGEPPSDVALYFAVRAFDASGNGSELAAESTVEVANAELWNAVSRVRFDNSANVFGANGAYLSRRGTVLGDIDGDGRDDWATGSLAAAGFCVFLGQASLPDDLAITGKQGTHHTCLLSADVAALFPGVTPAVTQTGHLVQGLGDLNGDGLADFGMSGKISNGASGAASNGYVAVYFGRAGQLPTLGQPNILVRGLRALSGGVEFLGFCSPGDFDGVRSNDRLTSDLVVTEPYANAVYVIPGSGSWTSATALVIDREGGLPVTGGWSVSGAFTTPTATTSAFGQRCAAAGDVLPTPSGSGAKADLLVRQAGGADPRVFVFAGREWSGTVAVTVSENLPGTPTGEDAISLRLRQDGGAVAGFGTALQGDVDVTGDGVADILASNPARRPGVGDGKSVYVFDGALLAAYAGTDVRVGAVDPIVGEAWTGANGWVLRADVGGDPFALRAVGDFDGWTPAGATVDLVVGNFAGLALTLRLGVEGGGFEPGQFPFIDGEAINRYHPVDGSVGVWSAGADLTQDGLNDLIVGGNLGEVLIFH